MSTSPQSDGVAGAGLPLSSRILDRVPPGGHLVRSQLGATTTIGPLPVPTDEPVVDVARVADLAAVPGGVIDLAAVEVAATSVGSVRLARAVSSLVAPGGWLLLGGAGPGAALATASLLVRPRRWSVEGRLDGWFVLRRAHLGTLDTLRSLGRLVTASVRGSATDHGAS